MQSTSRICALHGRNRNSFWEGELDAKKANGGGPIRRGGGVTAVFGRDTVGGNLGEYDRIGKLKGWGAGKW